MPTIDDYLAEFTTAKNHYSNRDIQIDVERSLIKGDYKCGVITGQPEIKPDLPKRAVEIASSHIATGYPVIDVMPDKTVSEKESRDKLVEYYKLSYWASDEYLNADPDTILATHIAAHGGGVMKMMIMGKGEPVVFVPVYPGHFYPGPGGRHFYEAYECTVGDAKAVVDSYNNSNEEDYGTRPWSDSWFGDYNDDYEEIVWVERWTDKTRSFFLTGKGGTNPKEIIIDQENALGISPYAWRATNTASGEPTDPTGQWVGVLRGVETIYEGYARVLTAQLFHTSMNAYGEYWATNEAMRYLKTPQAPGQIREMPDGFVDDKMVSVRPETNLNADFYPFMQRLFDHANDFGVNTVLSGVAGGEASGRRYESELGAAEKKIVPMRKVFEAIKSQCGNMMATVLKSELFNRDGAMIGGDKVVKRSDIKKGTKFKITMEVRNPMYDQMRIELGLRLFERGAIPLQLFVEDYLKIPDSAKHIAKILAEKMFFEDEIMRMIASIDTYDEMGMDEEAAMLREQLMLAKQSKASQGASQGGQNAASHTQTIDSRAIMKSGGAQSTPEPQRM